MQPAEHSVAPLALSGRMIVATPVVDAVVLVIAVRWAHGGAEVWIRHVGGVLKVAGVEAMVMLVQETGVVGNRRHPAVDGRVSVDVRRRLFVTVADLVDRSVRWRTPGRKGRRHHGWMMMMPVKGRKTEGVGQSHGTISLMWRRRWRRRWLLTLLPGSVRNISRFFVAVVITIAVAELPLVVLPRFAFDLDAGLRGLGHLDLNSHPVVSVRDNELALNRETGRRSRRRTRRTEVLVAAAHAGLLHSRVDSRVDAATAFLGQPRRRHRLASWNERRVVAVRWDVDRLRQTDRCRRWSISCEIAWERCGNKH